ncbi:CRISPR system precrRNA processing endoribonuclease RAMP protein Cas6 [Rosettibacter firmus]|uniref:CRISPR system precrRNA processing endoribonuclease RAMP protein Cas6 n=1 Tax=Rosettibacter firmus TaxID=3111522 RepID=UPI00336C2D7A
MDTLNNLLKTELPIHKYLFRFHVEDEMKMLPPFKGSMLRGAFGKSLKGTVCISDDKICEVCLLKKRCYYFTVFETEIEENNLWFLKGVRKQPHPFVIDSTTANKVDYSKGEFFDIGVSLFSLFPEPLPYFILAFEKLGRIGISFKRYRLKLQKVFSVTNDDILIEIYNAKSRKLKELLEPYMIVPSMLNINASKVLLTFLSPLRLQNNSSILKNKEQVTAEIVLRTILRRVYVVLNLFYQVSLKEVITDFSGVKISKNEIYYNEFMRFSNRQKKKMEFGGFLGSIELEGKNLSNFIPYIILATHFNIGKNTVFGYGKYSIKII